MPLYSKTTWVNEVPDTSPVKYKISQAADGDIATDATIEVVTGVTPGTPLNSTNLNKIENGIEALNTHDHSATPGSQVPTAGIANLAVTLGKLADNSVDDTKAGDRMPQFYRRQGGSATNWATAGATSRTPGTVRMQAGSFTWTGAAANNGNFTVTYPVAFSDGALVFLTAAANDRHVHATVASSSGSSGFTGYWEDTAGATHTSVTIYWLAIGPE